METRHGQSKKEFMDMYAFELAELVRQRKVSPVDIVKACLERIEQRDGEMNSFVFVAKEKALKEAKKQEVTLARGGYLGVLGGVPIAVKDMDDVRGMPTTNGVRPLLDHIATEDSVHVARLKQAGAIIIGKTNVPAFGYTALTKNLVFGVSRNPFDLSKSPGGSSGGSAAAVAGRLVPLATSTDGGGSIRIPSTLCGTFGYKPTRGLIPKPAPRIGNDRMQNWLNVSYQGPTARCVKDAALYMHVCSGYNSLDPLSLPYNPDKVPESSFLRIVAEDKSVLPRRLNIAFSLKLGIVKEVEDEIEKVIRLAIKTIHRNLHHNVTELSDSELALPDFGLDWGIHVQAQVYQMLRNSHLVNDPEMAETMEISFTRPWKELQKGKSEYLDSLGELSRKIGENDYRLSKLFENYDLLITPAVPYYHFPAKGPFPTEINGKPVTEANFIAGLLMPFNYSGHPSCIIRAGMLTGHGMKCEKTGRPIEMPVGFQVVARRHEDFNLLAFASQYERLAKPFDKWPKFPFPSSSYTSPSSNL